MPSRLRTENIRDSHTFEDFPKKKIDELQEEAKSTRIAVDHISNNFYVKSSIGSQP